MMGLWAWSERHDMWVAAVCILAALTIGLWMIANWCAECASRLG